jgi:nucleoid DNA-binding protein
MNLQAVSWFVSSLGHHGKRRTMTDPKVPVRRPARTQPAKASAAPRSPGPVAAGKPAVAAPKAAVAKTAATKAALASKELATKSSPKPVPKVAASKAPPVAKARTVPPKPAPAATASVKTRALPKGDSFKLRMLVDQVVKATGAKKKGVKDVVEATLSRIGEALARGDELNLPGFGKMRVVKSDAKDGTAIMTLKLRQGTSKPGQKGLADHGDDD